MPSGVSSIKQLQSNARVVNKESYITSTTIVFVNALWTCSRTFSGKVRLPKMEQTAVSLSQWVTGLPRVSLLHNWRHVRWLSHSVSTELNNNPTAYVTLRLRSLTKHNNDWRQYNCRPFIPSEIDSSEIVCFGLIRLNQLIKYLRQDFSRIPPKKLNWQKNV